MRSLVTLLMISSLGLAGCSGFSDSGANPANWFGKSSTVQSSPIPIEADGTNPLIPEKSDSILSRKSAAEIYAGTPIYAVQSVVIDRSSGGAIIRATGLSQRQGAFDVRLVPENRGKPMNGVLTFTMRAVQPSDTPQGSERTRRVSAGQFITAQTLEEVREVRVLSQASTATSSR